MLYVHENNMHSKIAANYKHKGREIQGFFDNEYIPQIAITSWTRRGKNLGHGWSRRIYP